MNEQQPEDPAKCPDGRHQHPLKVIECDGENDVVECQRCHKRKKMRCNFNEDYS